MQQQYEIRILRPDGRPSLITATTFWDDRAAISAARKLASGHDFEVWRGMVCVLGTPPTPNFEPPPDILPPKQQN
jgi:hypothetical protein